MEGTVMEKPRCKETDKSYEKFKKIFKFVIENELKNIRNLKQLPTYRYLKEKEL